MLFLYVACCSFASGPYCFCLHISHCIFHPEWCSLLDGPLLHIAHVPCLAVASNPRAYCPSVFLTPASAPNPRACCPSKSSVTPSTPTHPLNMPSHHVSHHNSNPRPSRDTTAAAAPPTSSTIASENSSSSATCAPTFPSRQSSTSRPTLHGRLPTPTNAQTSSARCLTCER